MCRAEKLPAGALTSGEAGGCPPVLCPGWAAPALPLPAHPGSLSSALVSPGRAPSPGPQLHPKQGRRCCVEVALRVTSGVGRGSWGLGPAQPQLLGRAGPLSSRDAARLRGSDGAVSPLSVGRHWDLSCGRQFRLQLPFLLLREILSYQDPSWHSWTTRKATWKAEKARVGSSGQAAGCRSPADFGVNASHLPKLPSLSPRFPCTRWLFFTLLNPRSCPIRGNPCHLWNGGGNPGPCMWEALAPPPGKRFLCAGQVGWTCLCLCQSM
ncbi:uncharacterized protein LOC110346632 [Heterocephalus glaber]|uniref:Uncharacterized protein LOC110346632 n=1 Tax=Heterocephalus glaber TaxID=10181 RepID=A0AAX6S6T5_HETGA|nr:uncharacterized protein LOC110346632 [Heterocephalus glaber]